LDERTGGLDQPGLVEDTLLEPTIPHGGTLPPHVLTIRPFLWLVLGVAAAGLAFWGFLAAVFAQAAFEFHASSSEMAVLGLSISAPYAVFIPLQGVLVDRWSPKWMNLCGYLALVAAVPVAWTADSLVSLYVSTALVGVAFATIEPARSSLTGLLVDERRLVQANGMISAASQLSLMVGTLAGGFITEAVGVSTVYVVAMVASVVSIGFNLVIPDVRQGGERPAVSLRDLAQGLRTVRRIPEIRLLVVVGCVAWLMVTTFFVLEPIFIKDVLHRGESAVSFLWFMHGLGAMLGAVAVSRTRRGVDGRRRPVAVLGGRELPGGLPRRGADGRGFLVHLRPGARADPADRRRGAAGEGHEHLRLAPRGRGHRVGPRDHGARLARGRSADAHRGGDPRDPDRRRRVPCGDPSAFEGDGRR
jgi:MFS family permease